MLNASTKAPGSLLSCPAWQLVMSSWCAMREQWHKLPISIYFNDLEWSRIGHIDCGWLSMVEDGNGNSCLINFLRKIQYWLFPMFSAFCLNVVCWCLQNPVTVHVDFQDCSARRCMRQRYTATQRCSLRWSRPKPTPTPKQRCLDFLIVIRCRSWALCIHCTYMYLYYRDLYGLYG